MEALKCAESPASPEQRPVRRLPFVFVFGRSNFTVSYFGANIYPENISVGLEQDGVKEWVTGKFVLEVVEDDEHGIGGYRLLYRTRARQAIRDDEKRSLTAASVEANLIRLNSEFAHYTPAQYRTPQISLKPAGDPDHFPVGVKHRYTRA